jgi:hypothetical protein
VGANSPDPAPTVTGGGTPADVTPPQPQTRFVVYEVVSYAGSPPAQWESRYSRPLTEDEQPYGPRHLKVGPGWAPLDTGWVAGPALLLLSNPRPAWSRQPTADQRKEAEGRVVEVGWDSQRGPGYESTFPFALVRPGESCRFEPAAALRLRVRCLAGECRLTVVALPR